MILGSGDITDLSGLAGKTLGVQGRYGAGWYTTLVALDRAGLSEDKVGITEIGWTQVAALTTGKTDAVVGFSNNEAIQLKAAGFPYNQLDVVDKEKPNLVGPGLITREGVLPVEQLGLITGGCPRGGEPDTEQPGTGHQGHRGAGPRPRGGSPAETGGSSP